MPAPVNTPEQIRQGKRYEACFRAFGRGFALHAGGSSVKENGVEVYAAPTQNVFNCHIPRSCPGTRLRQVFETTLRLAVQMPSGLGVIIGPSLTHEHWAAVFKELGIRCSYWVPFMHRDLSRPIARPRKIDGIHIRRLTDFSVFKEHAHPYSGKLTTAHRKAEVSFVDELVKKGQAQQLVAWHGEVPVGAVTLYFHRGAAATFNVGVHEAWRGRGIGGALLLESLKTARKAGAECAVLSAAGKAVPLYERVGFTSAGHYGSYYIGRDRLLRIVREL